MAFLSCSIAMACSVLLLLQVFDLLHLESGPLQVRYNTKKGFYVQVKHLLVI